MSLHSEIRSRLNAWFRRAAVEREMEEELRDHLAHAEAQLRREGYGADEARRVARARFGGMEAAREGMRDERGGRLAEDLWRDVRLAVRSLLRRPTYTATAVLALGLGIAAATAIFSLVSLLLLRPLDVDRPEQLVVLGQQSRALGFPSAQISMPTVSDIAAQEGTFAGVLAYAMNEVGLQRDAGAATERWFVHQVTGNYFDLLGVRPAIGRLLTAADEARGDPVVVLSWAEWMRRFAGDSSIVGRSVRVNGSTYQVVGVAAQSWRGLVPLSDAHAYLPLRVAAQLERWPASRLEGRSNDFVRAVARLRDGTRVEEARAVLATLARTIAPLRDESPDGYAFLAEYEPRARPVIVIAAMMPAIGGTFLALAVLVLLIACVNVGNLVLWRTMVRRGELALRRALGASSGRLFRELFVEAVLLGVGALAVALPAAWGIVTWLTRIQFASDFPIYIDVQLDASVLAFCGLAALGAGVVTGLVPAWQGTRGVPGDALRQASARSTAGPAARRWGRALLAGQLAFSLVLVIAGGLFLRSLREVTRLDLGFDAEGVVMTTVDLSLSQYGAARATRYFGAAEEALAGIPGVVAFGRMQDPPMGFTHQYEWVEHLDKRPIGERPSVLAQVNPMTPDALQALRMRVLDGRGFGTADDSTAPPRALVNEAFASRLWPGQRSVVGERFRVGDSGPIEIVGVVRGIPVEFPTEAPVPQYYRPAAQVPVWRSTFFVRTAGDPNVMLQALQGALRAVDPMVALSDARALPAFLQEGKALFLYRMAAAMTLAIGLLGLVQTIVGLYGVIAYATSQRTREFGIRLALGARRGQVVRDVMGPATRDVIAGAGVGAVLAGILLPLAGTVLAVSPRDPVVYGVAAAGLVSLALLAVYIPSWRATGVAPASTLRSD